MGLTQAKDKRVHFRVIFSTDVEYFDPQGVHNGEVVNISLGGMLIKARKLPSPGDPILVTLKLPDSERKLRIRSTVVWVSSKNSDGDTRSMGVVFDQMSDEDKKVLTDYITLHSDENVMAAGTMLTGNQHDTVFDTGAKVLSSKALVADDNVLIRNILSDLLLDSGFKVQMAGDGQEALQKIINTDFDLIFLDVHMPLLDGLSILKELRKRGIRREVIVVTSDSQLETAIEAVRLGASDYIHKPIDPREMQECVNRVMESSRIKSLTREYQHQLEKKIVEQEDRILYLFYEAIQSLIFTIEAKDEYTQGHSMRVTTYASWLVRALNLDFEETSTVNLASRLHDIGKLSVSDNILNKDGPLTKEEFSVIKQHPERGFKILTPIVPEEPLKAVLHHHERWDGGGYPLGLSERQIPLEARVINLCDAFDAMTSERVYKEKMDIERALIEVEENSETQFDPEMVPVFLDAVNSNIGSMLEN